MDDLRDGLERAHPQINVEEIELYRIEVFNRCENGSDMLLVVPRWQNIHPLLKVIPVDWDYTIPYGLLHSPKPSQTIQRFLCAVQDALKSSKA